MQDKLLFSKLSAPVLVSFENGLSFSGIALILSEFAKRILNLLAIAQNEETNKYCHPTV